MGVEQLKSRRWRYDFNYNGKRYRKGGYATQRLAQNAERLRRQEIQEMEQGLRVLSNTGEMTLFEIVKRFVTARETHWRADTYSYYRDQFQVMASAFPDDLDLPSRDSTEEALQGFVNRRKMESSASTANKYAQTLMTVFRFARESGLISWEPRLRKFKTARRMIRVITESEMNDILSSASPKLRSFVVIMANTGLRANEARQLKWRDVDFANGQLTVANSKTHHPRMIPLNSRALAGLKEIAGSEAARPPSPDLHVFNRRGKPLARIHDCEVDKLFKRLGIHSGNRLHAFRHYFASKLIARGADAATVKELLGHSTIQMTMDLYVHLFPDQKRKAVALLED